MMVICHWHTSVGRQKVWDVQSVRMMMGNKRKGREGWSEVTEQRKHSPDPGQSVCIIILAGYQRRPEHLSHSAIYNFLCEEERWKYEQCTEDNPSVAALGTLWLNSSTVSEWGRNSCMALSEWIFFFSFTFSVTNQPCLSTYNSLLYDRLIWCSSCLKRQNILYSDKKFAFVFFMKASVNEVFFRGSLPGSDKVSGNVFWCIIKSQMKNILLK